MSQQHVDSVKNVTGRTFKNVIDLDVPDNGIDTDTRLSQKRDFMTYRNTKNRIESDSDDDIQLIRETTVFDLNGGSRIETNTETPAKKPAKAKPVRPNKPKLMKIPSSPRESQKKTSENGGYVCGKSPETQNR